jgi:hypothetical protein
VTQIISLRNALATSASAVPVCGSVSDNFSFRWGIPVVDGGYTTIPNFFLDHYAEVGVTPVEFATIIHLARYQYEYADSECRPSLATVARQMGYSDRNLRKILAGLEERGYLVRHFRPGKTTIYDFSGFSRAVLEAAGRQGAELEDSPEPQFRPPRNPSSAEQQQEKEQTNNNTAAGGVSSEDSESYRLLKAFGVAQSEASKLAAECSPDQVRGWIKHAENAQGVRNPQGLVISGLRNGESPPSVPSMSDVEAPGGVFQ